MIITNDVKGRYSYQLSVVKRKREQLESILKHFRNDPDRHCCVKDAQGHLNGVPFWGVAVFTKGDFIDDRVIDGIVT